MNDSTESRWSQFLDQLTKNVANYIIPFIGLALLTLILVFGLGYRVKPDEGFEINFLGARFTLISPNPNDPQDHLEDEPIIPAPAPTNTVTTARPTSTAEARVDPIPSSTPSPTSTQSPAPTSIPTPSITNFFARPHFNTSKNSAGINEIFVQWDFRNIPYGAHYVRTWSVIGKPGDWVRYECHWTGPESGKHLGAPLHDYTAGEGLYSGTWVMTIYVDNQELLREEIVVDGNETFWDPVPQTLTNCY